jgi:DNA-binding response OmpR family regulator
MYDDDFDPSALTALVVDDNHYERSISLDQLRTMGFGRAMGAPNTSEAWELLVKINPDLVLVEWLDAVQSGLDFVRRVRMSKDAPNRAVSIFMLTARGSLAEVETARKTGADGFLRKPVSALALKQRVRAVVNNPQPFIVADGYVGPCRRRRQDPDYDGPRRRDCDASAERLQASLEVDENTKLARARVAALEARVAEPAANDLSTMRAIAATAQELADVADRIEDADLSFGVKELLRYLRACIAAGRVDPEVLQTHAAALHQLVHIPRALGVERQHVARGLKRMIDKKLRKSAHAA